jgi:predicted metal-binding protein
MMAPTQLRVCNRCRLPGEGSGAPRPGARLAALLRQAGMAEVVEVPCLSACKRGCAVAVAAPGKVTYLFGDLRADPLDAAQLGEMARLHQTRPDGFLSREARPERLRAGILARLPPLPWAASGGEIALPA